jgi:hypothetical protein
MRNSWNIHFGCKTPLSKQTTSLIIVSINDKADAMGFNHTFVDVNKMAFTQDRICQPFIILILQLGFQAKGAYIPVKIMKTPCAPGLPATPEQCGHESVSIPQTPITFTLSR